MSLATELKEQYGEQAAAAFGATGPVPLSDRFAAYLMARDLMEGDKATFKVGYTAENALLAVTEVFGEGVKEFVAGNLGVAL